MRDKRLDFRPRLQHLCGSRRGIKVRARDPPRALLLLLLLLLQTARPRRAAGRRAPSTSPRRLALDSTRDPGPRDPRNQSAFIGEAGPNFKPCGDWPFGSSPLSHRLSAERHGSNTGLWEARLWYYRS